MAKYSYELKLKIVEDYMNGKGGYYYLANKYGVTSDSTVKKWVNSYKAMGKDSLKRSRQNKSYSVQFKVNAVELYLTTEMSYQNLAIELEINNPSLLARWVQVFHSEGMEGLSKAKGRPPKMTPDQHSKDQESRETNGSQEPHIEELKKQVHRLEIENAFFKRTQEVAERGIAQSNEQISRVIHTLRGRFKLKDILEVVKFPKSTYMYWQKRFDREDPDKEIKEVMMTIRKQHADYGYRRMKKELLKYGVEINHKKLQRLMVELDIRVKSYSRKSRKYSSYKGNVGVLAPNRINGRFNSSIPYQKITTDTTEFKYYEKDESGRLQIKKLYLDPFMDLFNREIISFKVTKQPNGESIIAALNDAIQASRTCKYRRMFHSDQGWAYQMKAYGVELEDNNIFQSMSRKGNCFDNSPMENFFSILKQEMYHGRIYKSYGELKKAIVIFINYYNNDRMKEKLNWLSPIEYRLSSPSLKQSA
ncbi:IS3 family transposase [Jeotgalibaca sp. MA1X17-3]|uniref:IS3 family transposase n=1 Tax=Jeotgalibaca sp. MA1X17-3 TaxID=2908211 RepID=UPI001F35014E|nr:IS3 family transposase [Jeotgalibaca sp. MA1X17-3]UJF14731.1 IS3 family transposase [Jeotgalibaca sp. MA1X17-3]